MDELLEQIEQACDSGHFYLALFACLTLPDICGAISSPNGEAKKARFVAWFDRYVAPRYGGNFDGRRCYAFRCAALHQGRAEHEDLGYRRILFLASASGHPTIMHNNVLNDSLNLDLLKFCRDVISGVRQWLQDESTNQIIQNNLSSFLRRHEGGLESFVVGVDVYSWGIAMPTYEYQCTSCSAVCERLRSMSEYALDTDCPYCGSVARRVMSSAGPSPRDDGVKQADSYSITNNTFENATGTGISVPKGERGIIEGNKFKNVKTPIEFREE
jgi:putative FmdB family regulatory protein